MRSAYSAITALVLCVAVQGAQLAAPFSDESAPIKALATDIPVTGLWVDGLAARDLFNISDSQFLFVDVSQPGLGWARTLAVEMSPVKQAPESRDIVNQAAQSDLRAPDPSIQALLFLGLAGLGVRFQYMRSRKKRLSLRRKTKRLERKLAFLN
jgi:hypothetical protein